MGNSNKGLLVAIFIFSMLFLVTAAGNNVFAHHPGALGPLNHLGIQQVLIVFGAAIIDSFNPTAFGMLLLIVKQMLDRRVSIWSGFAYITGIIAVYVVFGLFLRDRYMHGGANVTLQTIQIFLALLLVYTGVSEILRANTSVALPSFDPVVQKLSGAIGGGVTFILGVVIGIVEIFTTGALFFAFIQALVYDPNAGIDVHLTLTIVYLIGLTLPLFILLLFAKQLSGFFEDLIQSKHRILQTSIGIILIIAGGWVMVQSLTLLAEAYKIDVPTEQVHDHSDDEEAHEHMDHDSHEADMDEETHSHDIPVEVHEGMLVPTVAMMVHFDEVSGGYNIHLMTENFEFTAENVNNSHVHGQGHAHIYVNGVKINRVYSDWYHLGALDPGEHEITVTLNANDHREYYYDGQRIEDSQTVVVE